MKGDFCMQQLEAELLKKRLPVCSCGFWGKQETAESCYKNNSDNCQQDPETALQEQERQGSWLCQDPRKAILVTQ